MNVKLTGSFSLQTLPVWLNLANPKRIYRRTSFSQPVFHPVCGKSIRGSKQNDELASR